MTPDAYVGRSDFLRALEAADWPAFAFGSVRVERGEDSWRTVTLTPGERRLALASLGRRELLTITPVARRRLRTWLDGQRGHPLPIETRIERQRRLEATLHFFGDAPLLSVVAAALALAPRCVSDLIVSDAMVITTGRSTAGWVNGYLPRRTPILLAGHLGDEWIARTVLHESAHVWTLDTLPEAPTRADTMAAMAQAEARGWLPGVDAIRQEFEDVADLLAVAWLS